MYVRWRSIHSGSWSKWHVKLGRKASDPTECGLEVLPDETIERANPPKKNLCKNCTKQ